MKAMYIGIFSLFSTAAYATDARVAAFQGNRGLTDDTEAQTSPTPERRGIRGWVR